MAVHQTRLFFRILPKSKELYALEIITLAVAFACSTLIILFSLNEFGYDRFHRDDEFVFRLLQRNTSDTFSGNRLSNRIPPEVFLTFKKQPVDSVVVSRVKVMNDINVITKNKTFHQEKIHATDSDLPAIFSFEILNGSLDKFREDKRSILISSSTSLKYFGTTQASGNKIKLNTLADTLDFSVAAVYKDFPQNTHEGFNLFIHFETTAIQSLRFDADDTGVYGKILQGEPGQRQTLINKIIHSMDLIYKIQPIAEIYFGPRVIGEEAKHGDRYSITLLICITALILFLALTSFINLTTLTLPYRSKELAVKKLAGVSGVKLMMTFAFESFSIVSASLIVAIISILLLSKSIEDILFINLISLILQGDLILISTLAGLFFILGAAPLFLTFKFASATPTRLLSTDTITFPKFKRTVTFLQLGISIFLMVASIVIRRQVNYSLLKEPGRNYDQVVYINYPKNLTNEGLNSFRSSWKTNNPNIVDVMATSQLPYQVTSKELNSDFYTMSVDPGFNDFFNLRMIDGNWFKPNHGDSILVVNEQAKKMLGDDSLNVIGVFKDLSGQFNLPEKAIKIRRTQFFTYNFLCIRILEVDIRNTIDYLAASFSEGNQKASISFLNKRFEEWLQYQDRLNSLSKLLAIISGILSCCAIYGLSISIVRDKLKQIAIHKLLGASTVNITRLLVKEFTQQMFLAVLIFGPLTYIVVSEVLRGFVYATHFNLLDPLYPLAYCGIVITLLCTFQAFSLNRSDLSSSLKG
jgi:putative ABC transport system permease protein